MHVIAAHWTPYIGVMLEASSCNIWCISYMVYQKSCNNFIWEYLLHNLERKINGTYGNVMNFENFHAISHCWTSPQEMVTKVLVPALPESGKENCPWPFANIFADYLFLLTGCFPHSSIQFHGLGKYALLVWESPREVRMCTISHRYFCVDLWQFLVNCGNVRLRMDWF